jgi:hypothetical protein
MPFFEELISRSAKAAKQINKVIPEFRARKEAAEAQRIGKLIDKSLKKRDSMINSADRLAIHEIKTTVGRVEKSVEGVLRSVKKVEEQTLVNNFGLKEMFYTGGLMYGVARTRWEILKESKGEELVCLKSKIEKQPELIQIAESVKKDEEAIVIYLDEFELNSLKHHDRIVKLEDLSAEYEGIKEDLYKIDFVPNKCLEALRFTIKELIK